MTETFAPVPDPEDTDLLPDPDAPGEVDDDVEDVEYTGFQPPPVDDDDAEQDSGEDDF